MHTLFFTVKNYLLFAYMLCVMYVTWMGITVIPPSLWLWSVLMLTMQGYATYFSYRELKLKNQK